MRKSALGLSGLTGVRLGHGSSNVGLHYAFKRYLTMLLIANMMWRRWQWANDSRELVKCYWQDKTQVLYKTRVSVPLSSKNPTPTRLGLNPYLPGERPATYYLNYSII
jgi:hypothetical protein